MIKQDILASINKRWIAQCLCALRTSATQAVVGEGNANATLIFIGEAPGKNEDVAGRPFIGVAGKLLDEMLHRIALKREDVYITNIVKYRPPNNRDPLPDEILACREWLNEEIQTIRPKIIVTLGRHALHYFLPAGKIAALHGTTFQASIYPSHSKTPLFLALYHPAAALYNRSLRATLIKDFQGIPRLLKTIKC